MAHDTIWWKNGVVYQIYPRSFMDSNGDGVGDIPGITSRLDYLTWLGIDAIWLSPIYPSPMADFGYDISNYTDVYPLFGTLPDVDQLIAEAHRRNLKLILDFVPNHTSDEHPWFQQSRLDRTNEKRDWYIWHDPAADGGAPNNWTSIFGGPAWQFDEQTGQYYLHMFDVKQPDLNWRNPEVRRAMYDTLRFWLDRGVDGFRVDVLWMLIKDEQFRDNLPNPDWQPGDAPAGYQLGTYTQDQPGIHEVVREMRGVVDDYGDRVFIGEIYLPIARLVNYYGGEMLNEAHLPFNFQLVTLANWQAEVVRQIVEEYEAALPTGAWPNWVLSNHDRSRVATRVGRAQARVAQLLLLTLRGTPTCYYGDELGMEDVHVPAEMMHDPQGKDNPKHSRDPERSPMQWNDQAQAGFTEADVAPWLPVADDYRTHNVATEQHDPHSFLVLTRTLLQLRHAYPALTQGGYQTLDQENSTCFVYLRQHEQQRLLVALNFSNQAQEVKLPDAVQGRVILSTNLDREEIMQTPVLHLRANEGVLIQL